MLEFLEMPGHLIRRMHQISVSLFLEEVSKIGYDLTPVQFAALVAVKNHPGIDQARLAGAIAYDRVTVGGVVNRLVQKDLLSRRVSVTDRRARELFLTPDGEKALELIGPVLQHAQELLLNGLEAEEREIFIGLLKKATEAANRLSRVPMRGFERTDKAGPLG
ncbi:MAG: transcriptional regulator [Hyphomicrobiales bacterium]|nr:MAG: transcriptional regulator [Hyphomicrobiales bacterium]